MEIGEVKLKVVFFRSESGSEPVRKWLKSLPEEEKKLIGEDIKTVQFGWPLGMPLVEKIEPGLWEIRIKMKNKISRVIFTVEKDIMILLHGFIKKSQKIPKNEIKIARGRLKLFQEAINEKE